MTRESERVSLHQITNVVRVLIDSSGGLKHLQRELDRSWRNGRAAWLGSEARTDTAPDPALKCNSQRTGTDFESQSRNLPSVGHVDT